MAEDTNIYFGRPGALTTIRAPRGSFAGSRQRRISVFELGVGGAAVDQMVGGARTYVISYEQLNRTDWAVLEAFAQGLEGPGPFALLDPGQRNMLPANVSGATSVTNGTGGFALTENSLILDTYTRSVSNGWGDTTTGQTYTLTGTASDFDVNGTTGRMGFTAVNTTRRASLSNTSVDFDITATSTISAALTGSGAQSENGLRLRYVDDNNYVDIRIFRTTTSVTVAIRQMVGGVETVTSFPAVSGATSASSVTMRLVGVGASLSGSAWLTSGTEPATPTHTLTTTHLTAGSLQILSAINSSVTNALPIVTGWDNLQLQLTPSALSSDDTYTDAGPRTLAWTVNNSENGSTVPALDIDWPSSVFPYGVPAVASRSLCFSCYVRGGGTDAIVTYTPRLIYRDIAGAVLSTTSGSSVASASGAFAQMFVTAVAPASTAYADMDVQATSGASIGSIGYFRRFLLNEGTTPDTLWTPGTGVWPVRFGELPYAWPFRSPELYERPSVALLEDVT